MLLQCLVGNDWVSEAELAPFHASLQTQFSRKMVLKSSGFAVITMVAAFLRQSAPLAGASLCCILSKVYAHKTTNWTSAATHLAACIHRYQVYSDEVKIHREPGTPDTLPLPVMNAITVAYRSRPMSPVVASLLLQRRVWLDLTFAHTCVPMDEMLASLRERLYAFCLSNESQDAQFVEEHRWEHGGACSHVVRIPPISSVAPSLAAVWAPGAPCTDVPRSALAQRRGASTDCSSRCDVDDICLASFGNLMQLDLGSILSVSAEHRLFVAAASTFIRYAVDATGLPLSEAFCSILVEAMIGQYSMNCTCRHVLSEPLKAVATNAPDIHAVTCRLHASICESDRKDGSILVGAHAAVYGSVFQSCIRWVMLSNACCGYPLSEPPVPLLFSGHLFHSLVAARARESGLICEAAKGLHAKLRESVQRLASANHVKPMSLDAALSVGPVLHTTQRPDNASAAMDATPVMQTLPNSTSAVVEAQLRSGSDCQPCAAGGAFALELCTTCRQRGTVTSKGRRRKRKNKRNRA